MGVGVNALFFGRNSLCDSKQHFGCYVYKNGCAKWRNGIVYISFVFAMDDKTILESVCGYLQDKTLVDSYDADIDVGIVCVACSNNSIPIGRGYCIGANAN